jgi:lysozyme
LKRVAALIAVVVTLGILLFVTGYLRLHYPSRSRYPVRGIDVSHHQGEIDWQRVRDSGVSFAYIKATEGKDFNDTRFQQNWEDARQAEIPRGAYHFFTFCSPGDLQAEHFLRVVPPGGGTLPLAVDVEFAGNCKSWTTIGAIRHELSVFLQRLDAAGVGPPVLYVTRESYRRIVADRFPSSRLWIRGVFFRPSLEADHDWVFWQYADRGKVSGVEGFVDLNVFKGAAADAAAILSSIDPPIEALTPGTTSDE